MKLQVLFIVMTYLLLQKQAYADDWIGLEAEPTFTLGIQYTEDESNNNTRSFYLSKTMFDIATLNLEVSKDHLRNRRDTFESNSYYGQLDWLYVNDINIALSYQFQGKKTELEVEQIAMQFGYSPYPFFMSVEIMTGDVILYLRDEIPVERQIPDQIQSDFNASTVMIGWWFESFSLSAQHQIFVYERDISALGSRPIFQLIIKPAALVQTGLLLSNQSAISIDYPLSERRLTGHLMQTSSAINNHQTRSLQLDWSENLNKTSKAILSINRSDENQDNWFFSVGFEWSA